MKKHILYFGFFVTFCLMGLSCMSSSASTRNSEGDEIVMKEGEYLGIGRAKGDTFLNARNEAIMNAVQKAVIDIIGKGKEEANRETLENTLYNTKDPNTFIHRDTLKSTRREMVADDDWLYECIVAVNMDVVKNTLKANGVLNGEGKEVAAAEPGSKETKTENKPKASDEELAPGYDELTEDEKSFIARYVDQMTYMVLFDDRAEEELIYVKAAVGKANEYLASQVLDTIDADQIEKLKTDQQTVYEEETGESISLIQWIAQKLNADIYVEIFGRTNGISQGSTKHYGEASIEIKAFEASTAMLLGAASYNTLEKSFSQTSQESAKLNAMQGAVYKTMPRLIGLVKEAMKKTLIRGIRYDVTIQNPLGDRTMSRFWSRLEDEVKSTKSVSQSTDEVKYYVWYIGSVDDLKNIIYNVTESIVGLENLEMVMSRGKSITFNTGS